MLGWWWAGRWLVLGLGRGWLVLGAGSSPWVRAVAAWPWSAHDCVELVVLARFGRVGVFLCAKTRHCCKNTPTGRA